MIETTYLPSARISCEGIARRPKHGCGPACRSGSRSGESPSYQTPEARLDATAVAASVLVDLYNVLSRY
jgi:hypothetical protein